MKKKKKMKMKKERDNGDSDIGEEGSEGGGGGGGGGGDKSDSDDGESGEVKQGDSAASSLRDAHLRVLDVEVFDDDDFYQQVNCNMRYCEAHTHTHFMLLNSC